MEFIDPDVVVGAFGVHEGMTVADFGVGRGFFALALARLVGKGGTVTGIDVDATTLEHLAQLAANANIVNLKLIRGNLELPGGSGLTDSTQDFALLANILFQSQQKEAILAEAQRSLKSGGIVGIIDWRKGAGGLGPPDELRIDEQAMRTMLEGMGLSFVGAINTGSFHFGMMFKKP